MYVLWSSEEALLINLYINGPYTVCPPDGGALRREVSILNQDFLTIARLYTHPHFVLTWVDCLAELS